MMSKVRGRSWWSLIWMRWSPKPTQSDFADMGDTIGLDASLHWEQQQQAARQQAAATEASVATPPTGAELGWMNQHPAR